MRRHDSNAAHALPEHNVCSVIIGSMSCVVCEVPVPMRRVENVVVVCVCVLHLVMAVHDADKFGTRASKWAGPARI